MLKSLSARPQRRKVGGKTQVLVVLQSWSRREDPVFAVLLLLRNRIFSDLQLSRPTQDPVKLA